MNKLRNFWKYLKDYEPKWVFPLVFIAYGLPLIGVPAFCAMSVSTNPAQFVVVFIVVFIVALAACSAIGIGVGNLDPLNFGSHKQQIDEDERAKDNPGTRGF